MDSFRVKPKFQQNFVLRSETTSQSYRLNFTNCLCVRDIFEVLIIWKTTGRWEWTRVTERIACCFDRLLCFLRNAFKNSTWNWYLFFINFRIFELSNFSTRVFESLSFFNITNLREFCSLLNRWSFSFVGWVLFVCYRTGCADICIVHLFVRPLPSPLTEQFKSG